MSAVERQAPVAGQGLVGRLFTKESAMLVAVAVVVPNLLFLLVFPWLLVRRFVSPILYLIATLIALFVPWPVAAIAFVMAAAVDAFLIVSYTFDMPLGVSLASLHYANDIDVVASFLYVGLAAYFVAVAALLTCATWKYRVSLRAASPIVATLLAFGISYADYTLNGYKPLQWPAFESAVGQNGLDARTIVAKDRNLLIVLVEGMGAYADPAERALLSGRLTAAAADRFRIASGTSSYFGSTTGAESRELCGRWATFTYYLRHGRQDCLPSQLAAAGFDTISYHAGPSRIFSRRVWYPRIGIQKMNFLEDIESERPRAITRHCGTVFPGLCDAEIGDLVRADIRAAGNRRGLYYWLTLNSHLPYDPVPENRFGCDTERAVIDSRIPCQLTEIWSGVFDKVAAIMQDPGMPPLDILIVGDHNTPMWSRDAYRHFVPSKVDWYFIEDRRQPVNTASSH